MDGDNRESLSFETFNKAKQRVKENSVNDSFWDSTTTHEYTSKTDIMNESEGYASTLSEASVSNLEVKLARENPKTLSTVTEENENRKHFPVISVVLLLGFMLFTILLAGTFIVVVLTDDIDKERPTHKIRQTIKSSNHRPLFLNIPGSSSFVLPSALSFCLRLTGASLDSDNEEVGH